MPRTAKIIELDYKLPKPVQAIIACDFPDLAEDERVYELATRICEEMGHVAQD
jgi:hypothetical protein